MNAHFRFHSIPRATARERAQTLDQFAELLSQDIPLNDIATRMEVSRGSVCVFLHEIGLAKGGQAL